jgi:hypothetical protein
MSEPPGRPHAGSVECPGVIGAHARAQQVASSHSIADLVFVSGDEFRIVLGLSMINPSLPESEPMPRQHPSGLDRKHGGFR